MAFWADIVIGILRESLYNLIIITALCALVLIKRHISDSSGRSFSHSLHHFPVYTGVINIQNILFSPEIA